MLANRLKVGDTIGIISPSTPVTENRKEALDKGIKFLNELGLKVQLGKYVFQNTLGYSATKEEKAEDINQMFSDKTVKAIFSSKGGENSFTCLKLIDYEAIKKNPKIIYGISDATIYLNAIYAKTGMITFHQSDVVSFSELNQDSFEKCDLVLRLMDGKIGTFQKNSNWKSLKSGETEGIIVGGNIKAMINLLNTEYMPDLTDKILFLEAYAKSTPLELIDCYLAVLKYHGVFDKINGLWIGYYKGDTETVKFEDVVMNNLKEYHFPILKCNDFGHNCENVVIPIGAKVKLDATNCEVQILEEIVDKII